MRIFFLIFPQFCFLRPTHRPQARCGELPLFGLSERRLQFKALCFFASPAQKLYFSLIFVNCFRLNLFLKAVKLYLILQLLCIAVRSILFGEGLKLAGAVFFGVAFLFPQLILCRDYCGNGHQALLARLFAVGLFYYNPELFNGFGRERRHKLFVLACFSISSFGLLRNLSRYLSVSIPFLTAVFCR